MIWQTWGEVYCRHCKAKNFITLDRDHELLQCYKCSKRTPLMEDVEEHINGWTHYKSVEEFIEEGDAEKGVAKLE